jgi:microcystin-dependent protein
MADIFISYAKEDRERAGVLAEALAGLGWSVFWDRTIPAGLTWREFIGKELEEARSVVVAWSAASVKSQWVLEEAEQAKKKRILVPVLIQPVEAPFGFGSLQAADLSTWDGRADASAFQKLAEDMGRILGVPPIQAEQEERRQADEAGRKQQASEVPAPEDSDAKGGDEAEPVSAGGEVVSVDNVGEDDPKASQVERKGDPVMTYLKEKLLPGVIAALAVAAALGIVSATSSGRLISLMGGATQQSLISLEGGATQQGGDVIPPGTIVSFAGPESNVPAGWLLCDGAELSIEEHSELYEAIGTAWGKGVKTFRLPDLRGVFLRGVSGDRGDGFEDPDAQYREPRNGGNDGKEVGSFQAASLADHQHMWAFTVGGRDNEQDSVKTWKNVKEKNEIPEFEDHEILSYSRQDQIPSGSGKDDNYNKIQKFDEDEGAWTGPEPEHTLSSSPSDPRPKNAYVNFIIKY